MAIYKVIPAHLPAFIGAAVRANANCVINAISKCNLQSAIVIIVHTGTNGHIAAPVIKQLGKWALPIATCPMQQQIAAQYVKSTLHNVFLTGKQSALAFNTNVLVLNGITINWQ